MKRVCIFVTLLSVFAFSTLAQADQKLINKAQQGDPAAMVRLGLCYEMGDGVSVDSAQALKWFQRAADAGNGDGAVQVSCYYLTGTGVSKDTARCLAMRREWAEKGCPNAISGLATFYLRGWCVKADTAKAIEMFRQAADKGSDWACLRLGELYGTHGVYDAYGIKYDKNKEIEYLNKAYKAGSVDAAASLASVHLFYKDYRQAAKWVKVGCKQGNPDARGIKAIMLLNGWDYPKDEGQALRIFDELLGNYHNLDAATMWAGRAYLFVEDESLRDTAKALRIWREGCERGFASCQVEMSYWYSAHNDHVSENRLLHQAASQSRDNSYAGGACQNLAINLWTGQGCDTDKDEAIRWAKRGADICHSSRCALTLGSMLEESGDAFQAAVYYTKAYRLGETDGMVYCGRLYAQNGNKERAMESFQQLVDDGYAIGYFWVSQMYDYVGDSINALKTLLVGDKKGSKECSELLGDIYAQGHYGITPDFKKAADYYKHSGSPRAHYMLALIYSRNLVGKNEKKNIATAMDYLRQSAAQGYGEAIYSLGTCYETGKNVDSIDHSKALECYRALADQGLGVGYLEMGHYYENGLGGLEASLSKAAEYYQKAADQGNGEAMCYLGDFYREGFDNFPADKAKAFEYFMRAHEAGTEGGTYYVGRSYLEGCGVDVDTAKAIPYLTQAAEMGVGNASYKIAEMYRLGNGGFTANSDSAWAYYLQAHRNGSAEGSYMVGKALMDEGESDLAVETLLAAAQRGSIRALVSLAVCLQNGIGVEEPDPETAYKFLEVARQKGTDEFGYCQLGIALLQGNGCPEDMVLGKKYLDTAAQMGSHLAMLNLGVCYLHGYGCIADTTIALQWLEQAADNGSPKALVMIGDVHQNRDEHKTAVRYYEKAMAQGYVEAICEMGYCYQEGLGVVLNSAKALELYVQAANQGSMRGIMLAANCYLEGIGTEVNAGEALKWYTLAAESGNAQAMYYCSLLLREDHDTLKANKKQANEWIKKAAAAGYEPAEAELTRNKK